MVLCELDATGNFFLTWAFLYFAGMSFVLAASSVAFKYLYWRPTLATWSMKTNPKYPQPEKVREEIYMCLKGLFAGTFCPAVSLYLSRQGMSQAYCGVEPHGWSYLIGSTVFAFVLSDFFEWAYHYFGHATSVGWENHKPHHQFYNPSPFSVISDDLVDQFVRSSPMLILPVLMPINMDMLTVMFSVVFYLYGIVLHTGHEPSYPDAHHPFINGAYHHYLHHAKSIKYKPYHTGFMVKWWDQLAGSVWDKECLCIKCQKKRGERTEAQWEDIQKTLPDYSPLLSVKFWLQHPVFGGKQAA